MHDQYVSDWFYDVWAAVSGMTAAFPGGLDINRVSRGSGNYARYTVACERIIHQSDKKKSATYRIVMESYLLNPDTALKTATNLLDQGLLVALESAAGSTIGGGSGEPTGAVNYAWKVPPPPVSLQTDDERKAGGDVIVIKAAYVVMVQWA